ncbi:MAG TPA: T9SS type A sorting domain-containing protein, partial [Bacteroidia bacterium]|nr:T9SS type A sorting domain-containing protein [Bacteroidia bacterium]
NPNGTIDTTFKSNNSTVRDLARQADGKIIAVGGVPQFPSIGFGFVNRLNMDGSRDTLWPSISGPGIDPVYSVTILSGGQILVGGEFEWSWLDGNPPAYLSLFDSTGHVDSTFVGLADGPVYTTQGVANDKVIIGGAFHTYTNVVRNSIARIYAPNDVPTGIKKQLDNASFLVYPNPAESFIHAINLKQGSIITVRNISGAVIYSEKAINNHTTLNISNYANGIYFITEQNKDQISTRRFIVNK